ncbi:MAG TPA: zinc-dependent alcohol dehydrogenase family protein [Verrucomicrobiaceae bacterium]|jgi:alcohol dehydrogenase
MKTRAAVLRERGLPAPYAKSQPLVIEELELESPGEGEVLIEMSAAGLCHSDLSVINGTRLWPLPIVIGHEACGVVREIGPGVKDLHEGEKVVFSFLPTCGHCPMCLAGRASLCEPGVMANRSGKLITGGVRFSKPGAGAVNHHSGVAGYSQFSVIARESIVKIPQDIPMETAVLFGCAIMTGVGAVVNTARVAAGTSVAVFGMGGVGLSVAMGAKAAGAYPIIAVDRLAAKENLARQCGATHFIDDSKEDAVAQIRDLTHGGAETAFEAVGDEIVLARSFAATRRGGRTVAIGLTHPDKMLTIPAVAFAGEERVLMGSYMGSCVPQRDIPRFIEMYRTGSLPVELLRSRELRLEEVNDGFDRLDRGEVARQVIRF